MTNACPQCGNPFVATSKKQRYCTKQCRWDASNGKPSLILPRTHLIIPDTQVEPGRDFTHLGWIEAYCHDRYAGKPLTRVMLGDHWNMGSLSSYDRKGGTKMEGRRVHADIDYGNLAATHLHSTDPLWDDHWLLGNHEHRIQRAVEQDAQMDGLLSLDMLDTDGWQRHDFLERVSLDGVWYSHYFYNPNTGRPYAGASMDTRLKNIGHSFTMGHQQGRMWGSRPVGDGEHLGMVVGSCYLHDEDYLGPQGNNAWCGIVVCNNVTDGVYDPMFVGLDYLCRRYEGITLANYKEKTQ